MASVCNSLFAYHRTKTITWQGISATWWIRHLLWRTFWDEHSVGNRVSIWVHKRSSICWEYSESSCMSILGPFSVHSLVDSWLFVHDTFGVEGRPSYSCKATLLIGKLQWTDELSRKSIKGLKLAKNAFLGFLLLVGVRLNLWLFTLFPDCFPFEIFNQCCFICNSFCITISLQWLWNLKFEIWKTVEVQWMNIIHGFFSIKNCSGLEHWTMLFLLLLL